MCVIWYVRWLRNWKLSQEVFFFFLNSHWHKRENQFKTLECLRQNSTSSVSDGRLTHVDRLWSGLWINKHRCGQKMPWNKCVSLLNPWAQSIYRPCLTPLPLRQIHFKNIDSCTQTHACSPSLSSGTYSLTWQGNINPQWSHIACRSCQERTETFRLLFVICQVWVR